MASAAVASPDSEFEFNPSAPEFVPQQQQQQQQQDTNTLLPGLPGMSPALLPTVGASFSPRSLPRARCWSDPVSVLASRVVAPAGAEAKDKDRAVDVPARRRPAVPRPITADAAGVTPEKLRRQAARRATNAPEAPSQVATLVIKNLAMDLEKADVMKFLDERGAGAAEVDLHRDASGAFRGTAFARYASPSKARAALDSLGMFPEFGGRKARVEIQKSKALFGRKCLEAGLPQEELGIVREEIERFVNDPDRSEVGLPAGLSVQQRKYAHSLAERHNLVHATRQGESGEKFVYLSKARGEPLHGRKKAHSVSATDCAGSRRVAGNTGGKGNRQHAMSADESLMYDVPPGVESMPAYLNEPKLSGELLSGDAILASEALAALRTSSPIMCVAPGLPLPPGLELESLAGLAWQGVLPSPFVLPQPKALDPGAPTTGLDIATRVCLGNDSLETAGSLPAQGRVAEEE